MQINQNSQKPDVPAIINHRGSRAVGARDLYHQLGLNSSQFTRWAKKNITNNPFVQKDQDWLDIMSNGKPDFVLSLDFAKRLAMMARTQRGEQIRAYFIECEKMALEASRPRTQIDVLLESVQALHAQERKLSAVEIRVEQLEAQSKTAPDYFTIIGYASLQRRFVDLKTASALGSKAKAACRIIGCLVGKIADPRFGTINVYPREILESVFNDFFEPR